MFVLFRSLRLFLIALIIGINSTTDVNELSYRGASLTWRRLRSTQFNLVRVEMIITVALSNQFSHLCDSSQHDRGSQFAIECIDSWDHCLSWSVPPFTIECHSKTHDYPKSVIFTTMDLLLPNKSVSVDTFYRFRFPSSNSSCCWYDLDWSEHPVELISYLNLLEITEMNSPPIARFPEHLSIHVHEELIYSLEVFDPDGDLFECFSLSSTPTITISDKCLLTIRTNPSMKEDELLLQIEIVEYVNEKKDRIRSRLPHHLIGFINHDDRTEKCRRIPLINLLNVENDLIHVLLHESISIEFIAQSQCPIEMDECSMISGYHWKTKSIVETIIAGGQSAIHLEFEWTPRTIEHCGFHIHCIRCLDQFDNYNDKCLNIFVNGPVCHNLTHITVSCSWSPFTMWTKNNQTTYKRIRTCSQTSQQEQSCSFCFGSSIEYQSSFAFVKDMELFEQSLLFPARAHSTIRIISIVTSLSIIVFGIALLISVIHTTKKICRKND